MVSSCSWHYSHPFTWFYSVQWFSVCPVFYNLRSLELQFVRTTICMSAGLLSHTTLTKETNPVPLWIWFVWFCCTCTCFEHVNLSTSSLSHRPLGNRLKNKKFHFMYQIYSWLSIDLVQIRQKKCFISAILQTSDVCHFEKDLKKIMRHKSSVLQGERGFRAKYIVSDLWTCSGGEVSTLSLLKN